MGGPTTSFDAPVKEPQAARCQSITVATQAFCSGSRRRRYGIQARWRSSIDTSAGSAGGRSTEIGDVDQNFPDRPAALLHLVSFDDSVERKTRSNLMLEAAFCE
jgi:hypothetical protein